MLSLLSVWVSAALAADGAGSRVFIGVDETNAIGCVVDGKAVGGDACPLEGTGSGYAPLAGGPVRIPAGPITLRAGAEDDMCGHQRVVVSFDRARTIDLGRAVTPIALPSAVYSKAIAEATGVASPKITQLFKVDLEGDGKDEVIFAAESDALETASNGDVSTYAFVGVRRITAAGKVEAVLLHKDQQTWPAAVVASGEMFPVHRYAKVLGLTDIDGDKKVELMVQDGFYEGATTTLVRIVEGGVGFEVIGTTGCGN